MHKFSYLVFALVLGISACATHTRPVPTQQHATQPDRETIGWTEKSCLAIKNPALSPNQKIWWIDANHANPATGITIVAPSSDPAVCPALLPDRATINQEGGYYFYELANAAGLGLGVAFVRQSDSDRYEVSSCVTSEGIAFSAKPKSGVMQEEWNGYYYLGYDTESTCAE